MQTSGGPSWLGGLEHFLSSRYFLGGTSGEWDESLDSVSSIPSRLNDSAERAREILSLLACFFTDCDLSLKTT